MPKRIQRNRSKGWRMPENTVYVGRPTRWGNQFRVGDAKFLLSYSFNEKYKGLSDAEVVAHTFEDSIVEAIEKDKHEPGAFKRMFGLPFEEWIAPLRGKNLACWCPSGQACHADVLLRLANLAA